MHICPFIKENIIYYGANVRSINENISPYQSCSKSVFYILGIIFVSWFTLFSIFLVIQGAWPVSIFLGIEYLFIVYLLKKYFREKNIQDRIKINDKEILIRKFRNNKLYHKSRFNTYWSSVFFKKFKNKSKLTIKESNKEIELADFLHTELKEKLYLRIKKKLNN